MGKDGFRLSRPRELLEALRQDASGCKRAIDRLAEHFLPGRYDPAAFSLRLAHEYVSLSVELTRGQGVPMKIGEAKLTDAMNRGSAEALRDALKQ